MRRRESVFLVLCVAAAFGAAAWFLGTGPGGPDVASPPPVAGRPESPGPGETPGAAAVPVATVALERDDPRAFHGRVVGVDGTPIADAALAWTDEAPRGVAATTDAAGAFVARRRDAPQGLGVAKRGYVSRVVQADPAETDLGDLVLVRSASTILGIVRRPDGEACPGAVVFVETTGAIERTSILRVVDDLTSPADDERKVLARTISAEDGRFEAGLPPGCGPIVLRAESGTLRGMDFCRVPGGEEPVRTILRLAETRDLAGRVVDAAGLPKEGVVVSAVPNPLAPDDDLASLRVRRRSTRSGPDGTFAFPGADLVPMLVVAECGTSGRAVVEAAPPFDERVVLTLPAGHALEGLVLSREDRTPVSGASILAMAFHPRTRTGLLYRCRSGEDGRFVLQGLPEGPVAQFTVEHPEHCLASTLLPDSIPPVTVRGDARNVLADILLDSGATVSVSLAGQAPGTSAIARLSGESGLFDQERGIEGDGPARFDHVPRGRFALHVVADGGSAHSEVEVKDLVLPVSVEVRLDRGGTLRGRAVAEAGAPLPGADVALFEKRVFGTTRRLSITSTDADGRFAFRDVPSQCQLVVEVEHPVAMTRSIESWISADETAVDLGEIVLGAGCTIAGDVVDEAGVPLANAEVHWFPGTEGWGGSSRRILCDRAGAFEIRRVDAAGSRLVATAPGHVPAWTRVPAMAPSSRRDGLRLRLPAARIRTGAVVDEGGNPVAGASVVARWPVDPTFAGPAGATMAPPPVVLQLHSCAGMTDAEGKFEFSKLPTDVLCQIRVSAQGFAPLERTANLKPGKEASWKLVLKR